MFDPRYQVKQYVAVVQSNSEHKFMVFETGDNKFYFFVQMENCCATGLSFPVEKKKLEKNIKRMLRHGYGNAIL